GGRRPARREHDPAGRAGRVRARPGRPAARPPGRAGHGAAVTGTRPANGHGRHPVPRRGGDHRRRRALGLGGHPGRRDGRRGARRRQRLDGSQRAAGPGRGRDRGRRGPAGIRQRVPGRDAPRAGRLDPDGRRRRNLRLRRAAAVPGGGRRRGHGDRLAPARPDHAGRDALAPPLYRQPDPDRHAEPAVRRRRVRRTLRPADGAPRRRRPHRPAHDRHGVRLGDDNPGGPGAPRHRRDADHLRRPARGQPLEAALRARRAAPRPLHARVHERRPDLGACGGARRARGGADPGLADRRGRRGRGRARLGRRDAGAGGTHGARVPLAPVRPPAPFAARRLAAAPGGARRRRARRRDDHGGGGGAARPAPPPGDVHADPPPPPVTLDRPAALARSLAGLIGRHRLFSALLVAAAALRVVVQISYRPALLFYGDSIAYLANAAHLDPESIRPAGYPAFLRAVLAVHDLAVVPAVQHVFGLVTGGLVYALIRRLGGGPVAGSIAAAPVLFDAYDLNLEQHVLSEPLFTLLVVTALVVLLWRSRPSPAA